LCSSQCLDLFDEETEVLVAHGLHQPGQRAAEGHRTAADECGRSVSGFLPTGRAAAGTGLSQVISQVGRSGTFEGRGLRFRSRRSRWRPFQKRSAVRSHRHVRRNGWHSRRSTRSDRGLAKQPHPGRRCLGNRYRPDRQVERAAAPALIRTAAFDGYVRAKGRLSSLRTPRQWNVDLSSIG